MWMPWSYVTFATTLLPVMMLFTAESAIHDAFQVSETISATNRERIASDLTLREDSLPKAPFHVVVGDQIGGGGGVQVDRISERPKDRVAAEDHVLRHHSPEPPKLKERVVGVVDQRDVGDEDWPPRDAAERRPARGRRRLRRRDTGAVARLHTHRGGKGAVHDTVPELDAG